MDTLLCNGDGDVIIFAPPSATDEILAFHYGNFDDAYEDGTVAAAAANGRVYADTVPSTLPAKFGSIGTPSTASGQTTYTWTPPTTSLQANVLLVAGGGGGGGVIGGGGGAGGVVYKTSQTLNSTSYTIKVGQGGTGGIGWNSSLAYGNAGKDSSFGSYTVAKGGGGGHSYARTATANGGSGGGGAYQNATGGTSTQTDGYGNDGGDGGNSNLGAGGGGATEEGFPVNGVYGGDGGAGLLVAPYGENYGQNGWFAGGGGGGVRSGSGRIAGVGGIGGGGAATASTLRAGDGSAHLGGGGGGGGYNASSSSQIGGNGGSGIVLVRYIVDTAVITAQETGALDDLGSSVYTQAVGAYALRRLFGAYTGPQVKIRRSTDNAETDVYFDKYGYLVNFDVETWLGGGTGYVVTWYDQSSGANHVTQTTTTSQPFIVTSGDKPHIRFQNKIMTGPNVFGSSTITTMHLITALRDNVRSNNFFINLNGTTTASTGRFSLHSPYGSGIWYWDPGSVSPDRAYGATSTLGAKTVFSGYKSSINGFRLNGGTRYLSSGSTTATVTGGLRLGTNATDHSIYELLIFSSQLSDSVESFIEQNI